ncbi:MAG TPA: YidB family protein [Rhodopila sp.]|nr:YidB family protein [Rhodopila sp.]
MSMSMLGQLLGGLTGNSGGIMQVVMNALLSNQQGGGGGLANLVQKLDQGGLGPAVQSWVGTGQNQPVSPQDLHSALGQDQVQQMAGQTGMGTQELLAVLAQHLPAIIDKMTPNGQVPREPIA